MSGDDGDGESADGCGGDAGGDGSGSGLCGAGACEDEDAGDDAGGGDARDWGGSVGGPVRHGAWGNEDDVCGGAEDDEDVPVALCGGGCGGVVIVDGIPDDI